MLFNFIFKLAGWKTTGFDPEKKSQFIYAVCPHNTWVDFLIGLGTRSGMKNKIGYLGKEELFKPPFGFIFRALGGTPVRRHSKNDRVAEQVAAIKSTPYLSYALAPEGTRKNVEKLRSGFYHMAHGAGVPIVMIGFDFPKKEVIVAEPFNTTGDFKADMQKYFVPFFKKIGGFQKDWISNYEKGVFL